MVDISQVLSTLSFADNVSDWPGTGQVGEAGWPISDLQDSACLSLLSPGISMA